MTGVAVLPTIVSITIVLLVLGATLFILRWATQWRGTSRRRATSQRIEVLERHPVGRGGSLVLIRHAGAEHILGVTEQSITPITAVDIPDIDLTADDIDLRADATEAASRTGLSGRLEALRERTIRH